MPLKNYGVLKGKAIEVRLGTSSNAHYQVHLIDNTTDYRIAINVASAMAPSEVEYIVIENFEHPILDHIKPLAQGFTLLKPHPNSGALDFIRDNLFDRSLMKPLPFNVPGVDNDLNEKIDRVMQRAISDEDAVVYAFGERWGPESDVKDKFFGFLPGNGIHDIHMNQGNLGKFVADDGIRQDGGLIVEFPSQRQWVAIFLKFQSQSWHTDDQTGHRLVGTIPDYPIAEKDKPNPQLPPAAPSKIVLPDYDEPQGMVRIIAALVNGVHTPENETVTLLNTTPHDIKLDGWFLVDTAKYKIPLSGTILAGSTQMIQLALPAALSNKGGVITLIEQNGLKVDGVSYTKDMARNPGWTLVF